MSTPVRSVPEPFHFDREHLAALAESKREAYASASPFPHISIDEFLPDEVLDRVLAEFPKPQEVEWQTFDSANERKLASKDDSTMGEATRQLLAELNSATFIDFLQRLTGIDGLVPDPHFVGGGLHQIERGGHLKVHADFNRHPGTGLERRLNVLLYLNRDWEPEFGGAFELWNREMTASEAQILPLFNRCVIFTTTDTSFHGHPEPLNCPEGRTRKSIALYYYSKDRPPGEGGRDHNTLFQARPGEKLETPTVNGNRKFSARLKAAAHQLTPPILLNMVRRRRYRA